MPRLGEVPYPLTVPSHCAEPCADILFYLRTFWPKSKNVFKVQTWLDLLQFLWLIFCSLFPFCFTAYILILFYDTFVLCFPFLQLLWHTAICPVQLLGNFRSTDKIIEFVACSESCNCFKYAQLCEADRERGEREGERERETD